VEQVETTLVGKRGTIVVPLRLRKLCGLEEGDRIVIEQTPDGLLIRPATVVPLEMYSAERKAEFLLSNAVDERDYREALKEVRKLGLDPRKVRHIRPARRGRK